MHISINADLGTTAILYYDHAITFDEEYRHVWKNARSGSAILFLMNRYFAFFSVSANENNCTRVDNDNVFDRILSSPLDICHHSCQIR
jgi:hypothetical protein